MEDQDWDLNDATTSLSPLPRALRKSLPVLVACGFLSFTSSVTLFLLLGYRLIIWRKKAVGTQYQLVFLIFNLLLADMQQSLAFLINAHWLIRNELVVGSPACWAQGWFISTGDLASGVWAMVIALHTFASIVFDYRLSAVKFNISVLLCWTFVYAMAVIGVAMHPSDIYVRAGAWCWVNTKYDSLRIWLHYFWIFVFEFGNIALYVSLFLLLHLRARSHYFPTTSTAMRAKRAAKLMLIYPLIYVLCTIPLASARMATIAGTEAGLTRMCVAGAMITCNGWLDVIVFACTRRLMVFSDQPPPRELNVLDTFQVPAWGGGGRGGDFGTVTTCVAAGYEHGGEAPPPHAHTERQLGEEAGSEEFMVVKTETTVRVRSEPVDLNEPVELVLLGPSAVDAVATLQGLMRDNELGSRVSFACKRVDSG